MNLTTLVENSEDFTDEALQKHFLNAMAAIAELAIENPDSVRHWIEDGFFNGILDLEEDDAFGTEGLKF